MISTSRSPIRLLLPLRSIESSYEFGLPDPEDNLFQRLIRDPHVESSNPRERECTEMLCAVLRNTEVVREKIFRWMAQISGVSIRGIDRLDFVIETEGSIGEKRDDLRIEGWRETSQGRKRIVLWTVEVKVGANFHESSPLAEQISDDNEVNLVNQVANYDYWLERQPVSNRAGFVLALQDMSDSLPPNLSSNWTCFSWTSLGLLLEECLKQHGLPQNERFLTKHCLGFIKENLWSSSEMTDLSIGFDDIALLRAFSVIGKDIEVKVNRLVEPLLGIVESSNVGYGKVVHQKSLFKGMQRSVVWRYLFDSKKFAHPILYAGVSGSKVVLWIETAPSFEYKSTVRSVVGTVFPELTARNPNWTLNEEPQWWDLQLSFPLSDLLAMGDQETAFNRHFIDGIYDLKEVDVTGRIMEKIAN